MDKNNIGYSRWLLIAAAASVNARVALIMVMLTGVGGAILWCAAKAGRRAFDWPSTGKLFGGVAVLLLIGSVRELMAGGTWYGYPFLSSAWPLFSSGFSVGGMGLITAGIILGLCGLKLPLVRQATTAKSPFWRRMHFTNRFAGAPRMLATVGIAWMALAVWL